MSAIDDFLATQPAPTVASAAPASGPQDVSALLARDATNQSVPPALRAPQAPQQQPGMLASGIAGFSKGVGNTAAGIEQLLGKGVGAVGNMFAPSSTLSSLITDQPPQNFLQRAGNYLTNDANWVLNQIRQGAAPAEAAHPFVTGVGNVAGQIAGTAPTMMIGPEYAGLSLAGKLGLGAAQGAAGAAMMPVQNPGDNFWTQKALGIGAGGGLGAAGPLVAAGAGALGRGLWNAVQPVVQPGRFVGQGLAGAMDPAEAAAAAANIRSAPTFVSGYQPGTAALSQSPFIIQTEKAAGNLPGVKTALMNRNLSNNATLWDTLNQVGGTDLDLKNAIAARDTATTPLYNIAKQQDIPVDAPMTDLLSRPAMQTAIDRAQKLASNTNAGPIMKTFETSNPFSGATGAPGSTLTTLTGNGAQAVKESLDAMLLPENTQKLSSKEIGALQDTRSAYLAWLEGHSPAFTQARQTYAGMSPPINTMQAAQQMAERLGGLGRSVDASQNPIITAPGYATALNQALKGQEFGIEPGAQTTLENIGRELQRSTALNSVPKTGSDTAYNIAANGWLARQLYGPTFGGAGTAGKAIGALGATALGHPMVGLGILGGANKVGQMVGGRLQDRLSGLLMDPNAALPFLDARAAAAAQSVPGPLMQGLLNYGRPAAVNGLLGGLNNPGNK